MSKFVAFLNEESGAAAAEYVLIIAVIGGLVAAGGVTFGGDLSTALSKIGDYLVTKSTIT